MQARLVAGSIGLRCGEAFVGTGIALTSVGCSSEAFIYMHVGQRVIGDLPSLR
jgi:hypothetical protein